MEASSTSRIPVMTGGKGIEKSRRLEASRFDSSHQEGLRDAALLLELAPDLGVP
jgi:hypothetical protein